MDNQIYNDYMLTLFRESTIESLKGTNYGSSSGLNLSNTLGLFKASASVFNKGVAEEFLQELFVKYPSLNDKVSNYPYMFWKTPEAEEHIRFALKNDEVSFLKKVDELSSQFPKDSSKNKSIKNDLIRRCNELIEDEVKKYASTIIYNQKKIGDAFDLFRGLASVEIGYRFLLREGNLDLNPDVFPNAVGKLLENESDKLKYFFSKSQDEVQYQIQNSSRSPKMR